MESVDTPSLGTFAARFPPFPESKQVGVLNSGLVELEEGKEDEQAGDGDEGKVRL